MKEIQNWEDESTYKPEHNKAYERPTVNQQKLSTSKKVMLKSYVCYGHYLCKIQTLFLMATKRLVEIT